MKIDRHNYEEYFLLYVDNELDTATRSAVEAFAGRHPDLREELDLLLQFRAEPDPTNTFPDKAQLLKSTSTEPIHAANATEWLLLYADQELEPAHRQIVENYITQQPSAAEELRLLQLCRLPAETIEHPDKTSLYRREEKTPVIGLRRWRMAAAMLLLLLGAGTIGLLRQPAESGEAFTAGLSGPGVLPGQSPSAAGADEPGQQTLAAMPAQSSPAVSAGDRPAARNNSAVRPTLPTSRPTDPGKEQDLVRQTPRDNQLPRPDFNPNVRTDLPPTTQSFNTEASVPVVAVTQPALTNPEVTNTTAQPSNIVQAAYTDDGFAENPGKKNKLRGFFRKVTRTFEKRTDIDPTDNNRLLVAGLSIRLK